MRPLPTTPIRTRAAWRPADFANDDSWIIPVSDEIKDEIAAAVSACRKKGVGAYAATQKDFATPKFAAMLAGIAGELDTGRGFVLLRGMPMDGYSAAELKLIYWGLGIYLGTPISQNGLGELISEVTDLGYSRKQANVRGYTTREGQSPHTDHGDVVGLMCVHPAKEGGRNVISSTMTIFNEMLATTPELLPPLAEGFHFDLRGEGPTRDLKEVTRNRIPIFSYYDGNLSCKYNAKTALRGMEKAGMPLDELALAAIEKVRELTLRDDIRFDMDFRRGDVQLISNHTVVHARTGYTDWPEEERRRRLYRLWVNLPDGRRLAPEFADRTNMGYMAGFYATPDAKYWAGAPEGDHGNHPV